MKKILWRIRYALISLLVFLPQIAFAAAGSISPFSIRLFTPPSTDYSLIFLRKIFGVTFLGNVGTAIEHIPEVVEAHQTILGTLFGIFNAGVISIAAIFLIYTTVRSIVDTAHEGEIMGKKISHWAAIRAAFGIGILVPKFSGYSFIQIFVLWTIVQGVGLADHAWNMALDFLQKGGVIYETSATIKTDPNKIDLGIVNANKMAGLTSDNTGASDVFNSMICMHILDKYYQAVRESKLHDIKLKSTEYPKPGSPGYRKLIAELSTSYRFHTQSNNFGVYVPGFRKKESLPNYIAKDKEKISNMCGGYMWTEGPSKSFWASKQSGVISMITSLDSLASRMVDYVLDNPKDTIPNAYISSAAQQIVSAALSYQTIIYPDRLLLGRDEGKRTAGFYDEAKKDGWSMAGSYYHDISTVTQIKKLYDKFYHPVIYSKSPPSTDSTKGSRYVSYINLLKLVSNNPKIKPATSKEIKLATKTVLTFGDSAGTTAYNAAKKINAEIDKEDINIENLPDLASSSMFNPDDESAQQVFQVGFSNPMMNDVANFVSFVGSVLPVPGVIYQDLAVAVNNSIESWFTYMASPAYRDFPPIAKLYNFGSDLISNATQFWSKASVNMIASGMTFLAAQEAVNYTQTAIGSLGTPFGIGAGMVAALNGLITLLDHTHTFINTISMAALPLALAVTGPMITMGVIFSVYIPLIPFILFLFGVISWLIFVIEAIAAAPLVALGITHPEGHDLLGKSEQAIMLLLAVFLRPICMIIGLIVSIVLSYVALEVLNAGFAHVVQSTGIVTTDASHIVTANSIKNIGVLVAYTFIVVALINQSFSPIYKLIEAMMEWIGFHIRPSGDEQRAETVKGGVQEFGAAAGKGMGEGAAGLKDTSAGSLGGVSPGSSEQFDKVKSGPGDGGAAEGAAEDAAKDAVVPGAGEVT